MVRKYFLPIWLLGLLPLLFAFDCPEERMDPQRSLEAKLRSDLKCYYDWEERPVKNHTKAVDVYVKMSLKYLTYSLQEDSITVHSWLVMKWQDEFLTWNPSDYGNIDEIIISSNDIWEPRIVLLNADATGSNPDRLSTDCVLNQNGTVICVPHLIHTSICQSKLKYWPYDIQNCTLRFGTWMHTGEQINFKFFHSPIMLDDFTPPAGWKLLDVTYLRHSGYFALNSTFPSLRYYFKLKRISTGYVAMIVIPIISAVLLTLASILMDPRKMSRLLLGCISLFSHFYVLNDILFLLPKHSDDTPVVLLFIRDSMIMTVFSILLTLFMSHLMQKKDNPSPFVSTIIKLIESGPGKYAVFTEFDPEALSSNQEEVENLTTPPKDTTIVWKRLCYILNSISCIVLTFVYFVLILTRLYIS